MTEEKEDPEEKKAAEADAPIRTTCRGDFVYAGFVALLFLGASLLLEWYVQMILAVAVIGVARMLVSVGRLSEEMFVFFPVFMICWFATVLGAGDLPMDIKTYMVACVVVLSFLLVLYFLFDSGDFRLGAQISAGAAGIVLMWSLNGAVLGQYAYAYVGGVALLFWFMIYHRVQFAFYFLLGLAHVVYGVIVAVSV